MNSKSYIISKSDLPNDWFSILKNQYNIEDNLSDITANIDTLKDTEIFPKKEEVFQALHLTPIDKVKVIILGQDPYHDFGQAHGLSFSVQNGVKLPPSLRNIFKELYDDIGTTRMSSDLTHWAQQGVLLLNTALTVSAHQAASHSQVGWSQFTQNVLKAVAAQKTPLAVVLWGKHAQSFKEIFDPEHHFILSSAHPSPLSAYRGFFGSKPFSKINVFLNNNNLDAIQWED